MQLDGGQQGQGLRFGLVQPGALGQVRQPRVGDGPVGQRGGKSLPGGEQVTVQPLAQWRGHLGSGTVQPGQRTQDPVDVLRRHEPAGEIARGHTLAEATEHGLPLQQGVGQGLPGGPAH